MQKGSSSTQFTPFLTNHSQNSEERSKIQEKTQINQSKASYVMQNDLSLSLGLDTVSSVCVHPVCVHREIWPAQCVLLFSWPTHCVYLSVVKIAIC